MSRNFSSLHRRLYYTKPAFMNELNNGIHLGKNAPEPIWPINDNHLRLYSMRFCPYATRVHLVLNIKRIPYNVCYVELHNKPKWLENQSPKGKVPALTLPTGETLVESLIISDFLDEAFPDVPLQSKNPLQKAQDRLVLDGFVSGFRRIAKLLLNKSTDREQDVLKSEMMLEKLNAELASRKGNKFFFGERPGMLDLMIWPWFVKLPKAEKIVEGGKFNLKKYYPRLEEWKDEMLKEEAVRGFYISPEQNATFFGNVAQGIPPPYNLIAEKMKSNL